VKDILDIKLMGKRKKTGIADRSFFNFRHFLTGPAKPLVLVPTSVAKTGSPSVCPFSNSAGKRLKQRTVRVNIKSSRYCHLRQKISVQLVFLHAFYGYLGIVVLVDLRHKTKRIRGKYSI
jgi:hypothetical protein